MTGRAVVTTRLSSDAMKSAMPVMATAQMALLRAARSPAERTGRAAEGSVGDCRVSVIVPPALWSYGVGGELRPAGRFASDR